MARRVLAGAARPTAARIPAQVPAAEEEVVAVVAVVAAESQRLGETPRNRLQPWVLAALVQEQAFHARSAASALLRQVRHCESFA